MKVGFLSTFFPFRGGIAQFNASMYRALERVAEVKAFTFKRQYPDFLFPGETQFVTEKDIVDKIPAERVLDSINPLTFGKSARAINKFQPDLVLTKYWMTFFGLSLGTVMKKMRKETVRISILDNVIPHEKRFFDGISNRFFLKHNDGFIVMSDKVLGDLLTIKPDAKYLRVDHPLYDHFGEKRDRLESCERLGLDPTKKIVLFFGFIRDYKGLDVLIEATKHLDKDYQVVVAGEVYGSFDKYQNLIDELKVGDRIKLFNHYIGDDEVPDYFSAADVCVLPYKSATQSGITSISFHFELPMIATDVGGLKETIVDGKYGTIVPEVDSEAVASAIKNYFAQNLKEKYSAELKAYRIEHSWEQFVSKTLLFAEELQKMKQIKHS